MLHVLVASGRGGSGGGPHLPGDGHPGVAAADDHPSRGRARDAGGGGGGRTVRVKWGRWGGRLASLAPEYEDAAAIASATGLPVKDVMRLALAAAGASTVTREP